MTHEHALSFKKREDGTWIDADVGYQLEPKTKAGYKVRRKNGYVVGQASTLRLAVRLAMQDWRSG